MVSAVGPGPYNGTYDMNFFILGSNESLECLEGFLYA